MEVFFAPIKKEKANRFSAVLSEEHGLFSIPVTRGENGKFKRKKKTRILEKLFGRGRINMAEKTRLQKKPTAFFVSSRQKARNDRRK